MAWEYQNQAHLALAPRLSASMRFPCVHEVFKTGVLIGVKNGLNFQ